MSVSKQQLKDELVRLLEAELDSCERAYRSSREAATHEEAKPENDKDTRALEQSYLARGQALRVEELRTAVSELRLMPLREFPAGARIALGALVTVEEEGAPVTKLFVANHGGGSALAAGAVRVVTPKSPLGRALLGTMALDDVTFQAGGRARELSIVAVE